MEPGTKRLRLAITWAIDRIHMPESLEMLRLQLLGSTAQEHHLTLVSLVTGQVGGEISSQPFLQQLGGFRQFSKVTAVQVCASFSSCFECYLILLSAIVSNYREAFLVFIL